MALDKDIKILEYNIRTHPQKEDKPFRNALQLGIEALKREEKRRRFAIPDKVDLLPGETKD